MLDGQARLRGQPGFFRRLAKHRLSDRRAYLASLADQVAMSGFNFILGLAAIRFLVPTDLGLFSLWGEIAVVAVGFQAALVGVPLNIHVPAASRDEAQKLLRGLFLVNIAFLLLVAGIAGGAVLTMDAVWVPKPLGASIAAIALLSSFLVREYPRQAAFGASLVLAVGIMDGVHILVGLSTLVVLILCLPPDWLLFAFFAAPACGGWAAGIVGLALVSSGGGGTRLRDGIKAYGAVIHEVKWALLGGMASSLQDRIFVVLVTAFAGLEAVGAIFAAGFLTTRKPLVKFACLAVAAACVGFLILTSSKTSLIVLGPALAVSGIVWHGIRLGRTYLVMNVALASSAVGLLAIPFAFFSTSTIFTTLFGDPTFTGRTEIWQFLQIFIARHPWTGVGYGAFWDVGTNGPGAQDSSPLIRDIAEGHNGYLDLNVTIGYIGLALAISVLVWPFLRLFSAALRDLFRIGNGAPAALMIAYLAEGVFHNLTESSLLRGAHPVWVMSLMAVLTIVLAQSPAADAGRSASVLDRNHAAD